jgi:hypothetical protein
VSVEAWGAVFLAVIAVSTLVTAVVQVLTSLALVRLGRRVEELSTRIERDVTPVLADLAAVSTNAVRVSNLAVAQVERADRTFAEFSDRLDQTFSLVQSAIIAPIREGRAVMTAVRVAVTAFRELRERSRRHASRIDDDDPLFIG